MQPSTLLALLSVATFSAAGPVPVSPRNANGSAFDSLGVENPLDSLRQWALSIERPARFAKTESAILDSVGKTLGDAAASIGFEGMPPWSNTQITNTSTSLSDIAAAAIRKLMGMRKDDGSFDDIGWWQTANAYTAATAYDRYRGGKTFHNEVTGGISSLIQKGPGSEFAMRGPGLRNEFNDDSLWWTLTCLDATETYGNGRFQAEGQNLWKWVKDTSFITQTGIAPNMGGVQRTYALSDQCSLEHGVYWTSNVDETYVNSITTGLMMQASARLGTVDTALKNQHWLKSHTVDGSLVNRDGVEGNTCAVNSGAYSYNTGVYIAALTKLFQDTSNVMFIAEAEEAAAAAMETTAWTDGQGMITESMDQRSGDGISFKCVLLRALTKLYTVSSNAAIKKEIQGFVNVNYNSLYNKARRGDAYDTNWNGPFQEESAAGQFVAIDLLVAGMVVNA
ncbi:glycosyl hydrolase family 76-domain-containing protein [Sphaerosporella brunnea]|uniref:Glycosyl hydrolase family 76-domain-containing protein n=1 Tax=Sphaerosporella brunnea TaxID=1250544 RepID=A0A5J5EQG2_9PEZI|nr:glycosyl hydrolase family 76-domain-containing protein [Sphaerosporella brunnea]